MENKLKHYQGRVPACGVFCGGCPIYTRDRKPCPGAEINSARCDNCKSYHLCCEERGISHCYECSVFPCGKFKRFANNWLKYGQDLIQNQKLLGQSNQGEFLLYYNSQVIQK